MFRAEEIEADSYGLYLDLPFFFSADGSNIASSMLGMRGKALENSVFECFLVSIMLVFCSRWSRHTNPENLSEIDYPPPVLRLDYAARVLEMWCREVGKLPTVWQTDGTLPRLFADVIKLFPRDMQISWVREVKWLEDPCSLAYRQQVEEAFQKLRTERDEIES